jgi:glycosyltransferase involved in cell wall biosynthesis
MNIIYLGFNSFKAHKRGVENVIDFQSKSCDFSKRYYIHWGDKTKVYKNNDFVSISIKQCWYWPIILNLIVFRLIKNNNFIIHSHNVLFSVFGIFETNLFTVHDGLYYQKKRQKSNNLILFWIIEKILYLRCTKLHFISKFTKGQSLFKGKNNFKIIPNSSHFEKYLIGEIAAISQLQLPVAFTLIVKSIEERARFDLLLDLAVCLKDQNFVVAGKGPLLDFYKKIIKNREINNIQMLGYVDDETLLYLYKKCNLVINIAEYGEGFGLPIIEGYLFDKPVIASNKCAIPEVIISTDYLFENNIADLVKVFKDVFGAPKKEFKVFYEINFSNTKISQEFNKYYSQL